MNSDTLRNPYRPTPDERAPFAGRQTILNRLHQPATDLAYAEGLLIVGRAQVGKTALLHEYDAQLQGDDHTLSAEILLTQIALNNETDWVLALAQGATAAAAEHGLSLNRLVDMEPPAELPRAWLFDTFMPEFIQVLRPHRRLIFLVDDVQFLLQAINDNRLPADTLSALHKLLQHYRQLGLVMTLTTGYEADLPRFVPLVAISGVLRLSDLTAEESADLLRQPVAGLYRLQDDAVAWAHRAGGGQPVLMQRFGSALYDLWEDDPSHTNMTAEDVKAILPGVYSASAEWLRGLWDQQPANEKLVLTALAHLLYDDPLASINTEAIAHWLVQTDTPLDLTAVKAAVRSLEYEEVVDSGANGVRFSTGMLHSWLLEQPSVAALAPASDETQVTANGGGGRSMPVLLLVLALLAAAVFLLVNLSNTPIQNADPLPQPTVTLLGSE